MAARNPFHRCNSRRRHLVGQAIVELLLMLVVVIGTSLIFLSFSEGFSEFSNRYFGEYLNCLIETGELPALGSDTASSGGGEEFCNDQFDSFTFAAGRPPSSSSSGGSSGSASRSSSSDSSGSSGRTASRGDSSGGGGGSGSPRGGASGASGAGLGGGAGGSGGGSSGSASARRPLSEAEQKRGVGSGDPEPGGDTMALGGSVGVRSNSRGSQAKRIPVGKRESTVGGSGPKGEEKKNERVFLAKGKEDQSGGAGNRGNRFLAGDLTLKRRPSADSGDFNYDFGYLIRILFIVGVILMLLLFFGAQIMQARRNMKAK